MLRRIAWVVVALPVGALLVVLALANRHPVRLVLDPFRPQAPAVALELPFYAYLFAILILGVLLGGFAVWMSQRKWRRTARSRGQDALRWRAEADRLTRERDQRVVESKQLAPAGR